MPDDQNSPKNQDSENNSIPPSYQEPTEPAFENTTVSEPIDVSPEASEPTQEDFEVKSIDIAPSDSTLTELEKESKTEEKQAENEPSPEPVSELEEIHKLSTDTEALAEEETAQIPVNEPFDKTQDKPFEPDENEPVTESRSSPTKSPNVETEVQKPKPVEEVITPKISKPVEQGEAKIPNPIIPAIVVPVANKARALWGKALSAIQKRKRKKLDLIMSLFFKQSKITNDEVEKFLHVSDATATRYLSILEKERKIKQVGRTGKGVSYSKI